jgi:hypothetical protein
MSHAMNAACPIQLSQQEAPGLPVDFLVYPEDTYLVVDPYSMAGSDAASWFKVVEEANLFLPRPLGEVAVGRSPTVQARYLVRMVVFDFENLPPLNTEVLQTSLQHTFQHAARLGARSVCLDRLELLENSVSAYKLLKMIAQSWTRSFSYPLADGFDSIVLTLAPGPCWRRFEMALINLCGVQR